MNSNIKYPDIHVQLSNTDGNAFAIMGTVQRALSSAGVDKTECATFMSEAMSGDYNALLATATRWVNVS